MTTNTESDAAGIEELVRTDYDNQPAITYAGQTGAAGARGILEQWVINDDGAKATIARLGMDQAVEFYLKLWDEIHAETCAIAHGEREGRADYVGRTGDAAAGEPEEWAWPFVGDEAYINALGTSEICKEAGIDSSHWDRVCPAWLAAFRRGYESARDGAAVAHVVEAFNARIGK